MSNIQIQITQSTIPSSGTADIGQNVGFNVEFKIPSSGYTYILFQNSLPNNINNLTITNISTPSSGLTFSTGGGNTLYLVNTSGNPPIGTILPSGYYKYSIQGTAAASGTIGNNPNLQYKYNGTSYIATSSSTITVNACIHTSSMIKLENNEEKEIYKLKPDDKILAANNQIVPIVDVIKCWAGEYDIIFSECIVFEPNSLDINIPNKRFAIDPGHPICIPFEFKNTGVRALKPAKFYVNDKDIYVTTWDKVSELLEDINRRYDIIMPEDSCQAYIANNIIVKARKSRSETSYNYL